MHVREFVLSSSHFTLRPHPFFLPRTRAPRLRSPRRASTLPSARRRGLPAAGPERGSRHARCAQHCLPTSPPFDPRARALFPFPNSCATLPVKNERGVGEPPHRHRERGQGAHGPVRGGAVAASLCSNFGSALGAANFFSLSLYHLFIPPLPGPQCKPKKCKQECHKSCPVVRMGACRAAARPASAADAPPRRAHVWEKGDRRRGGGEAGAPPPLIPLTPHPLTPVFPFPPHKHPSQASCASRLPPTRSSRGSARSCASAAASA
jgi:hypothetical protein